MSLHRLGLALLVTLGTLVAPAVAAEPVLLRYKFAKGDRLIYRTAHEEKQVQTVMGQNLESTTRQEVVTLLVVDEIDGDGNAVVKTKAVHRKRKSDGQQGKFEFDSKSAERDTGTEIGAATTPFLERLTGSEYQIKVTPRGNVAEVNGFAELIDDLVKANPGNALLAGVLADNDGQKHTEQEQFVVFSDKPVAPGDSWEQPIDADLKGIGKMKGKVTYTYEGDDKVGDRKTARIGVKLDLTLDLAVEVTGAKITGTTSTTRSEGTVQFDPLAGRILSRKNVTTMKGPLTVEAGGMTIALDSSEDHTTTIQLLDKLPD